MENNIITKYQYKFQLLLKQFLKPDYKIINDVYLEMLITHLSGKKEIVFTELINSPSILNWIEESVATFSSDSPPINHIIAFTIRLLAIAIETEWVFITFYEKEVYTSIQNSLDNIKHINPSVKLANVFLMKSILKHSIGVHWIKKTQTWKIILKYCKENQTVYVVREAIEFINDYLFKIIILLNDDQLCLEILKEIVIPIKENVFDKQIGNVCIDDFDLQKNVTPILNLISFILEKVIISNVRTKIPYHLNETLQIKVNLWQLLDMTQDKIFFNKIMRVHAISNVAELAENIFLSTTSLTQLNYNQFGITFFNHMRVCVARFKLEAYLSVANLYNVLWSSLGSRAPQEIELEGQKVKFENQILLLQVMPILMVITKQVVIDAELIFDAFTMKLIDMATEHTMRICYSIRDLLRTDRAHKVDVACKAIQGIISMKKILHRDHAVVVFQALIYSIKTISIEANESDVNMHDNYSLVQLPPNLLSALLSAICEIIKAYRITWKDSIESICVLNIMLDVLDDKNITPRIVVQALKIIQLSIEHFLVPNLALLVNTLEGSGMENLGSMIMKRLHDINWEVRDSTIELLTSMVTISGLKFPAFQQHILDNGICPIIVSVAKNDSESFVRASALKCLASMVNIKLFWDRCLNSMDLIMYILQQIRTESEGIVRKESVHLINEIYIHQSISKQHLDQLFSTLAHCSVNDLYWEVKTNSLEFWKSVIKLQFQHQGMIDGTFPTVTFSKEEKKIVTLTQNEITLRLNKILNELSLRGCLGVLLKCVDDDCDLEVAKVAINIIKELLSILKTYNYTMEIKNVEKNYVNGFISKISNENLDTSKMETTQDSETQEVKINYNSKINNNKNDQNSNENNTNSDNIIESIVSANDINLLAMSYENQLNLMDTTNTTCNIDERYYRTFANITPKEFIDKIMSIDFNEKFNRRFDWIMKNESFSSLIDDMLYSLQICDVNEADCY